MPELAELAEQRGDTAGALEWLKRAYDGAQGPATRVQWGVLYVEGLLKLAPNDAPRIEQATASLIAELEAQPSGYHQRTRQRFGTPGRAVEDVEREAPGCRDTGAAAAADAAGVRGSGGWRVQGLVELR